MANRIIEKKHNPQSIAFDGSPLEKAFTATLVLNQTHDTVQDFQGLSLACKIPLVSITAGSVGNGITGLQFCIGGGVIPATGLLVPDNSDIVGAPPALNTTPGLCLFQGPTGPVDQPVNLPAAYSTAVYPTSEPDAIFPQGTVLTMRYTSLAGVAGAIRVTLLCIPVDIRKGYAGLWTWGNANIG